MFVSCPYNWT